MQHGVLSHVVLCFPYAFDVALAHGTGLRDEGLTRQRGKVLKLLSSM